MLARKKHSFYLPVLLLILAAVPAYAHAGMLTSLQNLIGNSLQGDESISMLKQVLGDFVLQPFAETGDSTGNILGSMFKSYNMFIFDVAMVWFAYNAFGGLAQTMHEGVVLGRRMSTVWAPVRFIFGAASLMPVFGGWAFCQALMVIAATLGIAGANVIAAKAIDSAANYQVLINPMGNIKESNQLHNIEVGMLGLSGCVAGFNMQNWHMNNSMGSHLPTNLEPSISKQATNLVMQFPSADSASGLVNPAGCGEIRMAFSPRGNSSLMGYRIGDVNYDGIRNVSMKAHENALTSLYQSAEKIVYSGLDTQLKVGSRCSDPGVQALQAGYLGSYNSTFQAQLEKVSAQQNSASNMGSLNEALTQKMKSGGWATLGTWYGVFAETNEAMNEMLDPAITINQPKDIENSSVETALNGVGAIMETAKAANCPGAGVITAGGTTSAGGIMDPTATGNRSVGQYLLGKTLSFFAGNNSTGNSQTVNPIIAFKNIGDNGLTLAEGMYVMYKAWSSNTSTSDNSSGSSTTPSSGGVISKVASFIPGAGILSSVGGGIWNTIASIGHDVVGVLPIIVLMLFVAGAMMAFYIPMIPFIQWFAGLLQWFTSIIESLIGASLWALAHFDSDGEGMGQRTSYGYLYLLNNFARPIIMVFAFFIANAAIVLLGTFLFHNFGNVIASAQGNTVTGLFSIAAYTVIFAIMGMTLVNGAFSIMLSFPDRIIGWIGQNATALDHGMESKINAMFINAANGARQLGSGPKQPRSGGLQQDVQGALGGGSATGLGGISAPTKNPSQF